MGMYVCMYVCMYITCPGEGVVRPERRVQPDLARGHDAIGVNHDVQLTAHASVHGPPVA